MRFKIRHYEDSLSNGVRYYFDEIQLKKKIRPINRLDRDTSGIVLFAKNEYVQECLVKQMKHSYSKKEYIAVVEGMLEKKVGTIHLPIARKLGSIIEREVCINGCGENAITHYEVIKEICHSSVVKIHLETGRTHQIRVHMAHIGYPIVGDMVYSNGKNPFGVEGQMLHAYHLEFEHPITQKEINLKAPLPKYFEEVLNDLRKYPCH